MFETIKSQFGSLDIFVSNARATLATGFYAEPIDGTGVQRTTNSRWGDYTSMNVDPTDDCTFWYVNEYYTLAGQLSSTAGWQTRIEASNCPAARERGITTETAFGRFRGSEALQ